ncbi:unnamed protein product [Adineta ricciae]|uniref:DUF3987 domain-containing protein n=1 Tax=Adineta ricciae TaxID=249248 RepID=A0A815SCN2_ADIRI|nr:unnamed protein product [Adineta ricciae]CAF1487175.1 unnamed protein product [Adineta ricciae]
MSSKGSTTYQLRAIMRKAGNEEMNIDEILDESTASVIRNISNSSQLPVEYLLTLLLPAVGHSMNGSQVISNTGQTTNVAFYTIIIGYPGANKSSGIEKIKEASLIIEQFEGIDDDRSRINNSATVESLLSELKNTHSRLFQLWDEALTLLQSFGMYKSGGAAYDRSIMCSLYNTSSTVRRQTKGTSMTIQSPVLNITAAAHPVDIFDSMKVDGEADGLMSRFLFAAPTPKILHSFEIDQPDPDQPSILHTLFIIHCFNNEEIGNDEDSRVMYSFSPEALKVLNTAWNSYTDIIKVSYEYDSFIASIYSKARVQIIRIAGALHAMSLAGAVFDCLSSINKVPNYFDKSKQTLSLLRDAVAEFKKRYKWQIISEKTTLGSVSMMNYYLKQKKIYANRKVNETAEEMLERFQKEEKIEASLQLEKEEKIEARKSNRENKLVETVASRCAERIILLTPGIKVPWVVISRNHGGFKVNDLHDAARKLDTAKIGKLVKEKKPTAKRATTYFIKTVIDENWDIETLNTFTNKLSQYSIKLKEYIDSCVHKDFQEVFEDLEDKTDKVCRASDVAPLIDSSQTVNISTNVASKEDTAMSFRRVDFQIAGGGFLLQKPSDPKPTIQTTTDTQRVTTDCNSSVSTDESPQLCQQSQDLQEKNHDQLNQRQQHLSNTFSSPSASPVINDLRQITPTKHTPKRIRFDLNNDEQNVNRSPAPIFATLLS